MGARRGATVDNPWKRGAPQRKLIRHPQKVLHNDLHGHVQRLSACAVSTTESLQAHRKAYLISTREEVPSIMAESQPVNTLEPTAESESEQEDGEHEDAEPQDAATNESTN